MSRQLLSWAADRGCVVAWGPARPLLEQVRAELEGRARGGEIGVPVASGQIDPAFASECLSFDYECDGLEDALLLLVAMPRAAHRVGFTLNGMRLHAVMPPTYQRYRDTFEDVRRDLGEHALRGHRVVTVRAPLKLLAARLGLVRYGRNNLAYAPGLGSYLQLLGYATDAPLPVPADWLPREPELLDECADCGICRAACPTGAIPDDRILLDAERCLTLATETAGPWPAHVQPRLVQCLIGCLVCQEHCPVNGSLPVEDSGVVFSEEETRALLAGGGEGVGPVWAAIRAHLGALGQAYQEPVIGRNLQALLVGRGLFPLPG